MSHDLVSVIIPSYNCAGTIDAAISSVLNQTYRNLELIIVDDNSTDESCAIAKQAILNEERAQLIQLSENSGGPARPRNRGIQASLGKYIAFLDADDLWARTKLETQVEVINTHSASLICGETLAFYSDSGTTQMELNRKGDSENSSLRSLSWQIVIKKNPISLSSVMLRKDALGDARFAESDRLVAVEDYELWLRLTSQPNFVALKETQIRTAYRIQEKSLSRDKLRMARKIWHLLSIEPEVLKKGLAHRLYYFSTYILYSLFSRG